ncbi:capping protein inhibiting regulator of actin dynamics isoform X3 [Oryzias melastigma]|uniref:capping protein inhibiting regulator of actin dynamics isoform X3 n=1 Tax=Oryzias melastigma TaxID=30732 RepID=UPI000CF7E3F1|nr:capping protein inhibiting regulator of actin dynamics isoform X3 [Oryzias melastigma]
MFPKVLLQWCAAISSCAAEIDRRRQGKFKPFRQLFGKKKKREAKGNFDGAQLKASFSSGEVCNGVVSEDEESNQNLRDFHPVGSRALSHDSIFIPEEALRELALNHSMSQENVSDKVKHLQKQIAQGIKFGQRPPSLRRSEGDEGSSEEEEVPRSPLQVLAQVEAEPQKTETKVSTPLKSPRSKQVLPPTGTIESVNLDAVPQSVPLLDNAAAKHKLSVKPKNQRISRKHRRFTQDLQEVSIPGLVQEELEAAGGSSFDQRRASADDFHWESLKKQRLYEEERQEAKRRREQEEQNLREEAEKLRLQKLEEERFRKQQEEEDRRVREEEEQKRREEAEMRRKEEEDKKQREEAERKRKEEERRIREELERQKQEEAERRRKEEERLRKEEERKRQEEDERRKKEEEMRIQEEEERMRKLEEEKRERERQRKLEEERRQLEEQRRKEEEMKKKKEEERRKREEEEARLEAEKKRKEEEEKLKLQEILEKEKMRKEEEQRKMSLEEDCGSLDAEERRRRAEELRWKEMEERQRPFSFKVSSGEKQILFQKVNLTPVTLASSLQTAAVAPQGEGARAPPPEGPDPPNLPASPYVPHTAILVTGAQLCGTAVNLDQIKDTACKSLLGLSEDRKTQGTPPAPSKTSPERRSGKTKSLTESALSTDQASAAVLAEWASIRSKIFKGVEDGKYDEYPDPQNRNQTPPPGEEQPPFAHANLRKTVSSSAKFSITPAKKKFGDLNRNSELFEKDAKEEPSSPPASSPPSTSKPPHRTAKTVRIVDRGSEECMFAKDLPSFLVPSPGERPEGNEPKSDPEKSEGEERGRDADDKPSPFGIKLRRTNYSLRFHSEQSTEKRKKRYSAGDSFDGVPSPLTPIDPDSDASSVFSDKSSSPQKDGAACKFLHASSPTFPKGKPARSASAASHSEALSKPPVYRRPPTSPKPSGGSPTPPPSPLPKAGHEAPCDDAVQRDAGSSGLDQDSRSQEPSTTGQPYRSSQGEDEPKEKRSFFPSINIPWREKADRKAELIKKAEKPSLQSRHSLDSPKVQDKEAGPLWITLALQKQKGFREQQQNREERRSQRETRLAEKQTREKEAAALMSPTDSKGSGSTSPSSKPQTPEELKRPDSLLGRFERREHLKKANTLPGSVTVEIADSTPSPPAVKDLSKRFPSSDSPGVSTEPAWLALAKRKAKAWSDCPQIIK